MDSITLTQAAFDALPTRALLRGVLIGQPFKWFWSLHKKWLVVTVAPDVSGFPGARYQTLAAVLHPKHSVK